MSVLEGIRVIELAETAAGEYCGKILAELGAQVIKIERPGSGSPTRSRARGADMDADAGALFAYLNTDKQSLEVDVDTPQGREIVTGRGAAWPFTRSPGTRVPLARGVPDHAFR